MVKVKNKPEDCPLTLGDYWEFSRLREWLHHASARCEAGPWASLPHGGPAAATTRGTPGSEPAGALCCVMLVTPGVESKKCNLFHIFNMIILVA